MENQLFDVPTEVTTRDIVIGFKQKLEKSLELDTDKKLLQESSVLSI